MASRKGLWTGVLLTLAPFPAWGAGGQQGAAQTLGRFAGDFPNALISRLDDDRISRVYGTTFGFGATPREAAAAFVENYAEMFGVAAGDLEEWTAPDGKATQPVAFDPATGTYKFTLVYYRQVREGLGVWGSELRILVRNDASSSVVWAGSSLRPLDGLDERGLIPPDGELGIQNVMQAMPQLLNFSEPQSIVWAGTADEAAAARVAAVFEADNGLAATGEYEKYLFVTDGQTGEILYQENRILNVDVVGNVSGVATQGVAADACEPEALTAMAYARVAIGGNVAYADENGDFVIANGGSSAVTVTATVRGRWFRVENQAGANSSLSQNVVPPGPANFVFNQANNSEHQRAEVNAYVHANIIRDLVIAVNPDYPTIADQTDFPANVNISSSCNAYYDYSSINFYRAAGSCNNTAFSDVVHHEYGHHIVTCGGSGQGAYGEGMGDAMGVLVEDNSELAQGFYASDCQNGIRDAENSLTYPCFGEIHYCGQLISGCVWETQKQLQLSDPVGYLLTSASLAINSVLLHNGSSINPDIYLDFLTIDDDDGDLSNGTPHFDEITAGFDVHNMTVNLPDPIECTDIATFNAACRSNGILIAAVRLNDASHSGQSVQFDVDGQIYTVQVSRSIALLVAPGQSGVTTVSLVSPGGCVGAIQVNCP